ncbi:MAG: hypothetical protein ACREDR_01980 [Blastocatellia bacterium]
MSDEQKDVRLKSDNPAARLYSILSRAAQGGGGTNRHHLARLLAAKTEEPTDVISALVDFHQMIEDAERKASRVTVEEPISREMITRPFPQIRQIAMGWLQSLDGPWNPNLAVDLTALELCSRMLSSQFSEPALAESETAAITTSVEELLAKVSTSSLSEDLKSSLIDGLTDLRRTIVNYPTFGAQAVRHALVTVAGDVVINYSVGSMDRSTPERSDILDHLERLVGLVLKAISIGQTLLPLAPFLLGVGQGS